MAFSHPDGKPSDQFSPYVGVVLDTIDNIDWEGGSYEYKLKCVLTNIVHPLVRCLDKVVQ